MENPIEIFAFFVLFGNAKKTRFSPGSLFHVFSSFLVPFGRPFGFLLGSFWSLRPLFGVPVPSFWVPLARLSRLWALSASFCRAFLLVWAVLGIFLLILAVLWHFCWVLGPFSNYFGMIFGVVLD